MMILNVSSKATGPIVNKFHVEPPEAEEQKIFKLSRSHDQNGHYAHIW